MKRHLQTGALLLLAGLTNLPAAVLYVDLNCPNPTPPYADWSTAAITIQDAVDAASAGDTILVTNGVYQTGGRPAPGEILTNRVVVTNALTLQSVNGPTVTVINGYQVPGTINGDTAVRCAHLADGCQISGFTLANGATRQTGCLAPTPEQTKGGGVWCQSGNVTLSNCVVVSNYCSLYGSAVYSGTVRGCDINSNGMWCPAYVGGAVFSSVVLDSTIRSNFSVGLPYPYGTSAGALSCVLSNTVLEGNWAGAAYGCWLTNCSILNNTNPCNGGGVAASQLDHCIVAGNCTSQSGGGTYKCFLNQCSISNNWAKQSGGGVYGSQTNGMGQGNLVCGNAAVLEGGGVFLGGNLISWTVVSNSSAADGGGAYAGGTTLVDGCTFAWNASASNGGGFCTFESFNTIAVISNSIFSNNIATRNGGGACNAGLANCSLAGNKGANGGGVYGIATNCVFTGNVATGIGGGLYCAAGSGIAPGCTFTNNSAANGGGAASGSFSNCVFFANSAVTNGGGVYSGTLNNCLVVSNQAAFGGGVCQWHGGGYYPSTSFTYLNSKVVGNSARSDGGGLFDGTGTNCLVEGNSAVRNGGGLAFGIFMQCTVDGNSAGANGGGATNATLTACVISNNAAAANGGGAYAGTLSRCVIVNNVAGTNGGGTCSASVNNSLLTGNSAAYGGGAYATLPGNSTLVSNQATIAGGGVYCLNAGPISSCIIYNNTAPSAPNYPGNLTCIYCCTTPLPSTGQNNLSSDPCFVNAAAGNYRLQTNSPCINAGFSAAMYFDLDGRPRVVGGATDIGAYEFQGPGMNEFILWLQQYGLPANGSADYADSDHDGLNNWQECLAGTDPTNAGSALKLLTPVAAADGTKTIVSWQSVTNRTYFLQRSQDLLAPEGFSTIQSNLVGQLGTTSVTDTNAPANGQVFYRVGVQ